MDRSAEVGAKGRDRIRHGQLLYALERVDAGTNVFPMARFPNVSGIEDHSRFSEIRMYGDALCSMGEKNSGNIWRAGPF